MTVLFFAVAGRYPAGLTSPGYRRNAVMTNFKKAPSFWKTDGYSEEHKLNRPEFPLFFRQ